MKATSSQPAELVVEGIDPILFIKQQLDLVEFALKQQQYVVATEKLAFLDMQLEKYNLAVALKQSLHQVIARDMQTIQKFVAERNEQQALINRQLQQIDQVLSREIQQPPVKQHTRYVRTLLEAMVKARTCASTCNSINATTNRA